VTTTSRLVSPRVIVIAAVGFSSLSSLLVRLSTAPPLAVAAWRMVLSAALVVPIVGIGMWRETRSGRTTEQRRASRRDLLRSLPLIVASGVFLSLHFATWITSLGLTSVAHSTVLVTMHPVIVLAAGSLFLGEASGRHRSIAAIVAVGGAILLSFGGSVGGRTPTVPGDLLAFAGAVAVSGYLILGRWARRRVDAWTYSLTVYTVAAILLVLFALLAGQPLRGYSPREFLIFWGLAFFCTVLGHGLINWGLRYLSAGDVSMYILLEPVFATVMALIWLGEIPGVVTVVGALIVLLSLGTVTRRRL
jgi:drug/metabolite transporter (DMT)-like permease